MYKSIIRGFIISLMFNFSAIAQEIPEETPPVHVTSEWVVPSQQPPTNHILFLIDGSGSMTNDKINVAINFALEIAGAPVDDLQIALATFGTSVARWGGTEDVGPSGESMSLPGWSVMPSRENLQRAREWLSNNMDSGSTYIIPGIIHSFTSCDGQNGHQRVENLTIIILTDGDFTDPMDAPAPDDEDPDDPNRGIILTLAALQQRRINAGLDEAVIGVIGINASERGQANLQRLAGSLGFLSLTFGKE